MSQSLIQSLNLEKVRVESAAEGGYWRVTLDSPKGNVLDGVMTSELTKVFEATRSADDLKAILLGAEGKHFCFGASVEEHQASQVGNMLKTFHALFHQIAHSGVPVVATVRGCCLGGGLELAAFCHRVIAHSGAKFGQPEIALGVFAPVGSAILAERVGRGAADDILLTGRTLLADEALRMRLVDAVDDDPETAARDWIETHLLPRSATSLRKATIAARRGFMERFGYEIEALERSYLTDLMDTHDANEGIAAFLEKRTPEWRNS